MANVESIAAAQKSLSNELFTRMAVFEAQLKASTSRNDSQTDSSLSRLVIDFNTFKEHVRSILNLIQKQLSEISKSTDILETRYRKKFLLLAGVPETQNENVNIVVKDIIQNTLNLPNITINNFRSCYRLGAMSESKVRPILIRFTDFSMKLAVWRKKTSLKGTSYVLCEYLTHTRQQLFTTARKRLGMRNVWTRDGTVCIKLPSGNIQYITSLEEYNQAVAELPEMSSEPTKSLSTASHSNQPSQLGHGRSKRVTNKRK